jgi:uncharacterized protein
MASNGAGITTQLHQIARDVRLQTPTGTLAGTLSSPRSETEHVAFIIAGSGPTDRDGNTASLPGRNDSLKLVAAGLNTAGIAALRVDKRGVAESAATPERELRFETYVDDAVAWLNHLKGKLGFRRFTIIGHSEGSLVGALAATRFPADSFISLEGAGRTAQDTILRQLRSQLAGPPMVAVETIVDRLVSGETVNPLPNEITRFATLARMFRPDVQPYLMSWFSYDPADILARLQIPILIVQGTTDMQVEVADAESLVAANHRARFAQIDGMNHVLKMAPPDPERNLATYSNPDLPLAPALIPAITRFLAETAGIIADQGKD